jgi:hypothetical protein
VKRETAQASDEGATMREEIRRTALAGAAALLVAAAAACGGGGGGGGEDASDSGSRLHQVNLTLDQENNSGETGSITLTAVGAGKTEVALVVTNAPYTAQPAHIHKGTCGDLDPAPAYPLAPVLDSVSTSTVNISLDDLRTGELAVNVHKSPKNLKTYVACGNLGE